MKKNQDLKNIEVEKKKKMSWKRFFIYIIVVLVLIALDQFTKYQIVNNTSLMNGESIEVIPGFFNLKYAFNKGAAFSFLADTHWGISLLTVISILATIFLFIFLVLNSNKHPLLMTSVSFILAGTVGNMIDRIRLNGVIDFLDFYHNDWHFPTFNVADSCITVGAILLIIYFIIADSGEHKEINKADN